MKYLDIHGQDRVIDQLKKSVADSHVSHAFIFYGDRYSEKENVAEIFARSLVCEKGTGEPCDQCHACRQALAMSHPDILHLEKDPKKKSIGVKEIREQINDTVVIKPFSAQRKVYIVPDAQIMTVQAQNALLKTFEEPPSYITIILLTDNIEMLLPTIRSRAVRKDFNFSINPKIKTGVLSLIRNIDKKSLEKINEVVGALKEFDETPDEILDVMLIWYRDVLLYKSLGRGDDLINKSELPAIKDEASRLSFERLNVITEKIEEARARLRSNVNFSYVMELLLLTIKER